MILFFSLFSVNILHYIDFVLLNRLCNNMKATLLIRLIWNWGLTQHQALLVISKRCRAGAISVSGGPDFLTIISLSSLFLLRMNSGFRVMGANSIGDMLTQEKSCIWLLLSFYILQLREPCSGYMINFYCSM